MPKKTKENNEVNELKKASSKSTSQKTSTSTAKKTSTKRNTTKKETTLNMKTSATKKVTTSKKSSTSINKKSIQKRETKIMEYYDLPYRYNQTMVKILAQTPSTLFIYWEISDTDIENYKKEYGENFFETTKPVLIVHNTTLNYSFEVEINDFANSWYLHIDNSKSKYNIELGRRPIQYNENIKKDYIYFTSSNAIEVPNDHILFNPNQKKLSFKNIKTNKEFKKEISNFSFIKDFSNTYDIYNFCNDINVSSSKFK